MPSSSPPSLLSPVRRSTCIDFVQGADVIAPGLSRAEGPLVEALQARADIQLRRHTFHSVNARVLFPYMYAALPVEILLSDSDLVHVASSWYAHIVPLIRRPTVVTCYDLAELEDARTTGRSKPHREFHMRAMLRGMERADRVVCSSHATAQALLGYLPGVQERLRVIHCSVDPIFLDTEGNVTETGNYVLYVGSEQPRKNLVRLVDAVAEVRRSRRDLRFIKVGGHQTAAGREELIRALERTGLIEATTIVDRVSDRQLIELYQKAAVLVQPSLREGFGYPAVEAMAVGCPVIVSNRDSLPEITGNAALVVDPLNVRDIARAIDAVLDDESLRRTLQKRGRQNALRFSPGSMIDAYFEVYRDVLRVRCG